MAFDDHSHFLKRSITGAFTDTIDSNLYLARTIQHACHRICSSHSQVIMTMRRKDRFFNTTHMLHQIFDLRSIFVRQTIAGRIRNVHYCSTCLNYSFHHTSQIFIVRTTCIFCIELHIIHVTTSILHGSYCTLDDFLTIGIEFILDMRIRCADTGMNTFMLSKLQSICSYIYIFLYCTGQCANSRPCHRFGYFNNRVEISRTGNRESGFNNIHAQQFQCLCYLNLFHCVQLASRNLLAIAERCVENK